MDKHKRFSCYVINDDCNNGDWSAFIQSFFCKKRYVEQHRKSNIQNLKSMWFDVYSPSFQKTFSEALNQLTERASDYDFFVIDLDLSQNKFIDVAGYEDSENIDLKSKQFAGLNCLEYLPVNETLRIIYSGSGRTNELYKYISLLSKNILSDNIILFRHNNSENFQKAEKAIDLYLLKRQIEVISRQDMVLRQRLLDKVSENKPSTEKFPGWDELLIPDNTSEGCEKFWSLRSLFPKQVNSILDNSNVENSYDYIEEILQPDWRNKFKEICNHPTRLGEEKCSLLRQTVIALELKRGRKAFDYRGLTECNAFPTLGSYNDPAWESLRIEACQSYVSYFASKVFVRFSDNDIEKLRPEAVWEDKLPYYARSFGIYPGDIKYLDQIAKLNKCHVNNASPFLQIIDNEANQQNLDNELIFIWRYNEQADPVKLDSFKQGDKFKNAINSPYLLDDGGMSDAIRLACFRYQGKLELQTADRLVSVTRKGFAPLSLDTHKIPKGITELRITIQKPIEWH